MIISRIEYENFRNFKEYGEIKCSTDGKVTVIYGKNGDGKTTLHQLFQWIFYGKVNFNKTTTDRLYNLQYESECPYDKIFQVMGCVEFEHNGIKYSLKRTQTYQKGIKDSKKLSEDLSLQYMDNDYNWRRNINPKETIEKLLPSGLSEYFFFDGENMIADLKIKGKDSAKKLRKALYSMFDLDILESAIDHIGRTEAKTTVLGKLFLSKGASSSDTKIQKVLAELMEFQKKLENCKYELEKKEKEKIKCNEIIKEISEKIGSQKSKAEYEIQRKNLQRQRDSFLDSSFKSQTYFGEDILNMFPFLLVSKVIKEAKKKIYLKIEDNKLPAGVTNNLVNYLLEKTTTKCICGHNLGEKEKAYIKAYLDLLPPNSYTLLYQEFQKTAKRWERNYDKERIEDHIRSVLKYNELAINCDKEIRELDEEEKKSLDIEDLITKRAEAEERIKELDEEITNLTLNIKVFESRGKNKRTEFDQLTKTKKENEKINERIQIMTIVLSYFETKLKEESEKYSRQLQKNIQDLIDSILTSKRRVSVTSEFSVCVMDSYNDESKSEGQFAVVSFAYIGGILKMLSEEVQLSNKEYPLILDGPFSKLDTDQRKNVVNMLPKFAPQVIIFSKDDLHQVFSSENIGYVWTIVSNDEKNLAHIEEGYLWK